MVGAAVGSLVGGVGGAIAGGAAGQKLAEWVIEDYYPCGETHFEPE